MEASCCCQVKSCLPSRLGAGVDRGPVPVVSKQGHQVVLCPLAPQDGCVDGPSVQEVIVLVSPGPCSHKQLGELSPGLAHTQLQQGQAILRLQRLVDPVILR